MGTTVNFDIHVHYWGDGWGAALVDEVYAERVRQEAKFPGQVLLYSSWDLADHEERANELKRWNDSAGHRLAWDSVLREELHEAFAEEDTSKMRTELIQLAALCFRVIQQIDEESH